MGDGLRGRGRAFADVRGRYLGSGLHGGRRAADAFAVGNTLGPAAACTAEKMRGADAVFGSNNVAPVVPVGDPELLLNPFNGVSGGSTPTGGLLRTHRPTHSSTCSFQLARLGSAVDRVFLGGWGGTSPTLQARGSGL